MKVVAVVGARPNFVKIAPIMGRLREAPSVTPALVHTGQHWDSGMSKAFFQDLGMAEPDVHLSVRDSSPVGQLGEMLKRLEPCLVELAPDIVLVVGDVTSTLAGALAAVKLGLPVAHVEAGLRSFDRSMPEEINRVVTDSVASLLFTTEPSANENLKREGIPSERVHFVGNVMIDSLFRFRDRAARSTILGTLGLEAGAYCALTLHRPSNVDDPVVLAGLLSALTPIQEEAPIVFPVHPRTRGRLEGVSDVVARMGQLRLTDPLPYLDFVQVMANARCVLTDSGGIQEETTALGVPCLTLRANTERPITLTRGTNRLVGRDPAAIYDGWRAAVEGRLNGGRLPELWDGRAAERIVAALLGAAG